MAAPSPPPPSKLNVYMIFFLLIESFFLKSANLLNKSYLKVSKFRTKKSQIPKKNNKGSNVSLRYFIYFTYCKVMV